MKNEDILKKKIGRKIKLARKQSNYTQEKLAEKTSLSTRYISQLERGLAFGSPSTIVNICNALNINSDFLFNGLITSSCIGSEPSVNNTFLDTYIKLDSKNRKIIDAIANQLFILQEEEKKAKII